MNNEDEIKNLRDEIDRIKQDCERWLKMKYDDEKKLREINARLRQEIAELKNKLWHKS